jgi:hypothetical protein
MDGESNTREGSKQTPGEACDFAALLIHRPVAETHVRTIEDVENLSKDAVRGGRPS